MFEQSAENKKRFKIDKEKYHEMYEESIKDSVGFWGKEGKRINWIKDYKIVKDVNFDKKQLSIKWFSDGTLNVSANCIDRHLKDSPNKVALIWQGDNPDEVKNITYKDLHDEVCIMANILKKYEVKKGGQSNYLYANDTRGNFCDACMCKNRGSTLSSFRRVFSRSS